MDSSPACLSYWDAVYENDIENYKDHGDAGDEWFGSRVSAGVITWISEKFRKNKNVSILDLGCGNGLFLIHLAQMKFLNLTGYDYSQNGIDLANVVSREHNLTIKFKNVDLLKMDDDDIEKFEIVHDKGTYDAITLKSETQDANNSSYLAAINRLVTSNGYFIITSCNFTEIELKDKFQNDFHFIQVISASKHFVFGGQSGATSTTAIFQKVCV